MNGKEVNAPGKWDLYLLGSQYPALIMPFAWYSHPNKLVLTFWKSGTWSRWTVIDSDQPTRASDIFALVADARNDVDVLFISPLNQEGGFRLMYAEVPSEASAIADSQRGVAVDSKQAGKDFIPVSSHPIEIAETQRECSGVPISLMLAGNPSTQGNLAVICDFLNKNLNWISFELNRGEVHNTQTLLPQPDYGFMQLKVFTTVPWAWWPSGLTLVGNGTWAMTVTRNDLPGLYLMTYQGGQWSSIEQLTGFDVAKSICFLAVSPQIIATKPGEAVAIWHESTGGPWSGHCVGKLMTRWIRFAN